MKVFVVVADAASQRLVTLEVPEGTTVDGALKDLAAADPVLASHIESRTAVGIWGQIVSGSRELREGDRIELYRPIRGDAKAMRRARAALSSSLRRKSGS